MGLFGFVLLVLLLLFPALIYFSKVRGTRLHEVLHLPAYWLQLYRQDTSKMPVSRIAYGEHFRQYFLYIPPAVSGEKADKLVVYFHGGGWKFGRPEQFKASILPFHEAGYPVILPSVRRTPFNNYYELRADLDQLLRTVIHWQQEQGWMGQKIVLGGMSSGGNLAALLGLDRRALAAVGQDQSIFAGLLLLGAPLALEKMQDNPVLRAFAGRRGSVQFQQADPVMHLTYTAPIPVFCIHGRKDGLVEYESAATFIATFTRIYPEKALFITSDHGTHLETAAWHHPDVDLKQEILSWLKKL